MTDPSRGDALEHWARGVAPLELIERRLHIADKATALQGILDDPLAACEQAVEDVRAALPGLSLVGANSAADEVAAPLEPPEHRQLARHPRGLHHGPARPRRHRRGPLRQGRLHRHDESRPASPGKHRRQGSVQRRQEPRDAAGARVLPAGRVLRPEQHERARPRLLDRSPSPTASSSSTRPPAWRATSPRTCCARLLSRGLHPLRDSRADQGQGHGAAPHRARGSDRPHRDHHAGRPAPRERDAPPVRAGERHAPADGGDPAHAGL